MKAVFYGSLIHHLTDTLLAKVQTAWELERFLASDSKDGFARALAQADVHTSAWTTGMVDRRWSEIADNLDRLARGEALRYQLK